MNKPLFGSIAALVIAGFIAAALPLVIAVTNAALQVSELGASAEKSVVQSVQMTRETESLGSELVSMERNARQYQVLGDESIRRIYLRRHDNVINSISRLKASDPVFARSAELTLIKDELATIHRAITSEDPETALSVALPAFDRIHDAANTVQVTSQNAMESKMESLSNKAAETQSALIRQSMLLGLLGLVLAVLFVRAILKPVSQINQTITNLGEERFDEPVDIGGPRDLRKIGERLDWLGKRLSELEGLKNEFMRHMSHELKTPLANIRESIALLRDGTVGQLTDAQREIVDILEKSSARLTLLINNLLDFSEWREQHASLSLSKFSVDEIVEDVIEDHKLGLENRGLRLDTDISHSLVVSADYSRIRTLVTNLLSNAIKYSPPGGSIGLSASEQDRRLVIEVTDEGPGIPEQDRQMVFRPFFQSTDSRLVSVEGTGVGLSLVQECVHAHGGKAEFLPVDKGSHFRATLPVVIEETQV